ncbi:MAG: AMP-binding protein [Oscillospiraceae bacterium]|nr:AMP-binding protein [Oscillospiraceae bacterium]
MKHELEKWKSQNQALFAQPPLKNLQEMLRRTAEMHGDKAAIIERGKDGPITHGAKELFEKAQALGTALLDLGLGGKHIAILGENSFDWILAFLAVTGGVGTVIPLDKELTDHELSKLLHKGDTSAVFCSRTYAKTVKRHLLGGSLVRHSILMGDGVFEDGFLSIDDLIAKGKALIAAGDRSYIDAYVSPESTAAILFTSGTTGANKGVMLTQRNLAANIEGIAKNVVLRNSTFSVLPMNHIYELNCNILPEIYANCVICINDSLRNIMQNFQAFQPGMSIVVPLFLETFYNNIWSEAEKTGQAEKLRRALKISNRLLNLGIDLRRTLFKTIHEKFGGNLSLIVCGGAPVNPKHVSGMSDFGFRIYVGYGLTEASPIAALNLDGRSNPESSGTAFYKTNCRIYEPDSDGVGEIWIRGENITKEYYKDPQATADSFENGWFKTGDYGKLAKDGHLTIVGRKKSLIVLDNGKNVHPEEVENFVKDEIPYIREIVVMEAEKEILGQKQKIIASIVFIDAGDFPHKTLADIHAMASQDIALLNKQLPAYKQVRDVALVTEDFAKTSTKKIIRQKVIEQYRTAKVYSK